MSTFHVRRFETSDQRRAGFLARQRQRDAALDRSLTPDNIETPRAPPIDNLDSPMEPRQTTPQLFNTVSPSQLIESHSEDDIVTSSIDRLYSLRNSPVSERRLFFSTIDLAFRTEIEVGFYIKHKFKFDAPYLPHNLA